MARKQPARLECPSILERHAALGNTEVVLSKTGDMFVAELVTLLGDGSFSRVAISGLFPKRRDLERRLMDFHAGVVVAQRAIGAEYKLAA